MEKRTFVKLTGAGNDFILFDRKENPGLELTEKIISSICDRRFGIGADGVLTVDDSTGHNFVMEYYNSDGSTGTLCGNGARCALRYAYLSGRMPAGEASFICNKDKYRGEILDSDTVKFYLNEPSRIKLNFKMSIKDELVNVSFADTGSPHVVANINDFSLGKIEEFPVFEIGKAIRYHHDLSPEGANVNFIKIEENVLKIRTYERGVEDETLACGTGATASAIIAALNYEVEPPIKLVTKSGAFLEVDFKRNGKEISEVTLTGPAVVTFNGYIDL